ncbi:MAG: hypothetical protein ACTHKB_10395 [Burkholderiaceae bacterium]
MSFRPPAVILNTAALCGAALVAACGGGGGTTYVVERATPPAAPTTAISGVFDGKTADGAPITTLLQNDGSYFLVYSPAAAPQTPSGVVLGTGTLNGGSFSSTDALDLSLTGTGQQSPQPATLSASYAPAKSFTGSIADTAPAETTAFTGSYNSSYATLPTLSSLAGVYVGSIATKTVKEENIELTISADGKVTGVLHYCGCSVTATLQKNAAGNAYYATLVFNGKEHPLAGKSMAGNLYADTVTHRIYIVGALTDKSSPVIFVGRKS